MEYISILQKFEPQKHNLLAMLHALQDAHSQNYLTVEAIKAVSQYLSLPLASVKGVVGYYSMFSTSPRGRFILRVCNSPVCNMKGAENLLGWIQDFLCIANGETTPDGLFTLEECECLGRCGKAPSMMINQEFYGNLTPDSFKEIINGIRSTAQ
jgi:NADH:ubiquinone oxidoreductase subunit E